MTAFLRRVGTGWYTVCPCGYETGPYAIGHATRLRDQHNAKHKETDR